MNASTRYWIYVGGIVLAVVVAGLALFGIVSKDSVQDAAVVLAIVYGALSALAAKNVNK